MKKTLGPSEQEREQTRVNLRQCCINDLNTESLNEKLKNFLCIVSKFEQKCVHVASGFTPTFQNNSAHHLLVVQKWSSDVKRKSAQNSHLVFCLCFFFLEHFYIMFHCNWQSPPRLWLWTPAQHFCSGIIYNLSIFPHKQCYRKDFYNVLFLFWLVASDVATAGQVFHITLYLAHRPCSFRKGLTNLKRENKICSPVRVDSNINCRTF